MTIQSFCFYSNILSVDGGADVMSAHSQCWVVTRYCNVLLFRVTSQVTRYYLPEVTLQVTSYFLQ